MAGRPKKEANELSAIRSAGRVIAPLHESIGRTQDGDWLDEHEEPGQSFEEYRRGEPVRPTTLRTTIYLQPLGDFDPARALAIEATTALLGEFYGVPVRMLSEWTWAGSLIGRGDFTPTPVSSKS